MPNEINPSPNLEEKAYYLPTDKTSEQDLLLIAKAWFDNCADFFSYLEVIRKQNRAYYEGKQTELDRIPADMSNAVQNHIFMGVETIVPIMTANPPQFVCEPPENSDQSGEYAENLQKILGVLYETTGVKTKGEDLVRHMIVDRLGVWKVNWDVVKNLPDVKSIDPRKIYIPKTATELFYLIEQIDVPAEEFRAVFGDEKFKKFLDHKNKKYKENDLDSVGGVFSLYEIWSPNFVFWTDFNMGFLVDKKINPYYEFEKKEKNHFEKPEIPYILASAFRLSKKIIGDTDLIQQTIPIQDVINVTNRQIINNANKMGNQDWRVDSSVMTKEEADTKLVNAAGLIIYGEGVANENLLRRTAPPPMPAYIAELKIMAERAFDNIFGTHSTTRGEKLGAPGTLGGKLMEQQADYGRIDLLVREFERCVELLGNWYTQLNKLFLAGKKTFRVFGETGLEFVNLEPSMIESGVKIIVKAGTTLPTDEISKRREALELWSLNALDPVTLFERLKFPNPKETAKMLMDYRQGQVEQETSAQERLQLSKGRQTQPMPSPLTEIGRAGENVAMGNPIGGGM